MSRYILIKCDDWHYDGFDYSTLKIGNSYHSKVIELTEEELKTIYCNIPGENDGIENNESKLHIKIRKVLE